MESSQKYIPTIGWWLKNNEIAPKDVISKVTSPTDTYKLILYYAFVERYQYKTALAMMYDLAEKHQQYLPDLAYLVLYINEHDKGGEEAHKIINKALKERRSEIRFLILKYRLTQNKKYLETAEVLYELRKTNNIVVLNEIKHLKSKLPE